ARLRPDGAYDSSFGTGGRVILGSGSVATDFTFADFALQVDGKILLGGHEQLGGNSDYVLIRLTSSGLVDPTFGVGGKVTLSVTAGDDLLQAIAVQSDGKILAAGELATKLGKRAGVARFTPNGDLDPD